MAHQMTGGSCLDCERYKREIARLQSEVSLLKEHIIKLSIDEPEEKEEVDEKDDHLILDLTTETLKDLTELHYSQELFMKGQKGIAEFIAKHVVKYKERYSCTDELREIFTYTDIEEPDTIKKDVKCKVLMEHIYPILSEKVIKVYRKLAQGEVTEEEGYDSEVDEVIAKAIKGNAATPEDMDTIYNIFLEIRKVKKNRQVIIEYLRQLPSYTGS